MDGKLEAPRLCFFDNDGASLQQCRCSLDIGLDHDCCCHNLDMMLSVKLPHVPDVTPIGSRITSSVTLFL